MGDRIGVASLFIVVVGVRKGNYVVAEVGTGTLDMLDGHHLHEVEENGVMVVIQNFQEMKSQHQLSLAKKMQGEYQDLGELIGTGIPGGHPGEDVFHHCSLTHPFMHISLNIQSFVHIWVADMNGILSYGYSNLKSNSLLWVCQQMFTQFTRQTKCILARHFSPRETTPSLAFLIAVNHPTFHNINNHITPLPPPPYYVVSAEWNEIHIQAVHDMNSC